MRQGEAWGRLRERVRRSGGYPGRENSPPLFRSTAGTTRRLTDRPKAPDDALRMIKRRAEANGLSAAICDHTFWATGTTAVRKNGGTLELAHEIANHARHFGAYINIMIDSYGRLKARQPCRTAPGYRRHP